MTLTLYGGARSRASMPRWYLEEQGIAYSWQQLDMEAGEHRAEAFTCINPFGKVPALVDTAFTAPGGEPLQLFESGAILLHLAEHYGGEFAGDAATAAARRSLASQWVLFANATLAVALFVPSNREKEFPRLMGVLDGLLAGGRSLMEGPWGDPGWGVADCAVHAYLAYLPIFFPQIDLSPYPNVQATIAATGARPAYQRVMGGR
ncbi:MAG: glutathione S-transferase [Cyanobacteria bacterium M_surface_7_m2_040]|nr:glutathione S-transferase [Cyanobacteria bacterium M_surface_7_m2_040]